LFRRDWPYFFAFDLLAVHGEDIRDWPLIDRSGDFKRSCLVSTHGLHYVDHFAERGIDLYPAACDRDLEGIVGKRADGCYESDGLSTSWVKIKNSRYSQMINRHQLFEGRGNHRERGRADWSAPAATGTPRRG